MKQLLAITGILLLILGIPSCYNEDRSFPDFDYTTTYFPYQYPIRTLVLGDYYFDNSNDNQLKFEISARMGGVYENNENISVQIERDPSLVENLYAGGVQLEPLSTALYDISSETNILIPGGSFDGGVTVTLDDAFLDDTLATGLKYVIPLKIINSTTDSVLEGNPAVADPDPRVAGDWITRPKNFTIFGIRYVNEYHGKYLLRGVDVVKDALNATIETISYRDKFVERSEVTSVLTSGRNEVTYTNSIRLGTGSPGNFTMIIPFNTGGTAVLHEQPGSLFGITGNAKFVKDDQEWGGQKRHTIYLDYVIDDGVYNHNVKDTLVFRDKAVTFAEFTPVIQEP